MSRLKVTHDTYCVYYLARLLILLNVHKVPYTIETLDDNFAWLQQTPKAKHLHI